MITLSTEYKKDGGDVKKGRFSYFCVSASRFHHYAIAWCNFICILHIFHDLYFNVVFFLSLINIMNIAVYNAAFGTNLWSGYDYWTQNTLITRMV